MPIRLKAVSSLAVAFAVFGATAAPQAALALAPAATRSGPPANALPYDARRGVFSFAPDLEGSLPAVVQVTTLGQSRGPSSDAADPKPYASGSGVIVDAGTFDFAADPEKFPQFNTPSESYHGLVFARDLGVGCALGANLAYILKARVELLRDLGSAVSPFNAFLIAQGLETLALRMERHVQNARKVAEYLAGHDQVERVFYSSLPDSPQHELAQRYAPAGAGAVLSFEIAGGLEAGKRFVDGCELHSHVANIGDVRSLVIHPASTTHSQGSDEDRAGAGVTPGLVRLAVGIEHIDDIIADLDKGFAAAVSSTTP